MKNKKPLGRKSYGSIGHLPSSRLGSGDYHIHEGQAKIATEKTRDHHDVVIIQEKLDGSNVGVAKINGKIVALVRAGYEALTSPHKMHHDFHDWVLLNENRFDHALNEGERICGEWLTVPHGTIYHIPHEPFVAFDIFDQENKRLNYKDFCSRIIPSRFKVPNCIHIGQSMAIRDALYLAGTYGRHGAQEPIEGLIYRIERNGEVDFLCKYVRHDKVDGKYLDDDSVKNTWVD